MAQAPRIPRKEYCYVRSKERCWLQFTGAACERRKTEETSMRRQRATHADRVSQVIEVIELGRRTGLLSVERDVGAVLEEGDLYFLNGQAIYASTGTQSGRSALETLRTWGACRFVFLSDIPKPVPNIGPERGNVHQTGGLRPGSPSAPLSGPQRPMPLPPAASSLPSSPLEGRRESAYRPPSYALPKAPQQPEGMPSFPPSMEYPDSTPAPVLAPHQRPRRAPNPQDIPRLALRYQLSRAHRTLLLLADGEHTVRDLARLVGRSEEEALALFSDLFRLGLITIL
jgi:hypothetical protein